VIWIHGTGYVVSPLEGVNGGRPVFIKCEYLSLVAVSERMAQQPNTAKLGGQVQERVP
jgi:hypothetical protein